MLNPPPIADRPRYRWYRFSLRTLVVIVTLCAIGSFVWRRELERWLWPERDRAVSVITIRSAVANQVANTLQDVMRRLEEKDVRIAVDERSNSICVSANARQTQTIKGVAKQLDYDNAFSCGSALYVYQLVQADAKRCVADLQSTFGGGDVHFSHDEGSNTVIVDAPPSVREKVEQILRARDAADAPRSDD